MSTSILHGEPQPQSLAACSGMQNARWLDNRGARTGACGARLCEAVTLEDRAAEHDLEELLDGGSKRCAAADDEAQAAAETLLDCAEYDVVQQRRGLGNAIDFGVLVIVCKLRTLPPNVRQRLSLDAVTL